MKVDLADFENRARDAVKLFWGNRKAALERQIALGTPDAGQRGAVTAGKNMDGFISLARALVDANGLGSADIIERGPVLTLPGFFRPTKRWDMLVMNDGQLVAALEFKSQCGPSFGNNFNNRTEEAIGNAQDLWTAFRDGAFGNDVSRPFVGWLMLLEDSKSSRTPVRNLESNFPVFQEFKKASYADRYQILCRKLVQEGLYSTATFLLSPREGYSNGSYRELSELTSLRMFVTQFAAHISAFAARSGRPSSTSLFSG